MENDRRKLTYSQAEGLEGLPSPLALGEASDEFRNLIWYYLHATLTSQRYRDEICEPWFNALRQWFVRVLYKPVDEFDGSTSAVHKLVKDISFSWHMRFLFDFLTYILRSEYTPPAAKVGVRRAFIESRMAYFIEDETIFPRVSQEEGATLSQAFADLRADEYQGARSHLREAGRLLSLGDDAGSVRESVHAVESVAKIIDPSSSTLSDALNRLSKSGRLNPNLKRGFNALYDWTSDEDGIRHAKVFSESASVSTADAIYMLGACAAFVSYLIAELGSVQR